MEIYWSIVASTRNKNFICEPLDVVSSNLALFKQQASNWPWTAICQDSIGAAECGELVDADSFYFALCQPNQATGFDWL
jgi:hypothetical protein